MLNLNELSATVGLPLSLEQGAIVVDFTFHSLAAAMKAAKEISNFVPIGTTIELRYFHGTMTIPYQYTIRNLHRFNYVRAKQSNGNGVTGDKI